MMNVCGKKEFGTWVRLEIGSYVFVREAKGAWDLRAVQGFKLNGLWYSWGRAEVILGVSICPWQIGEEWQTGSVGLGRAENWRQWAAVTRKKEKSCPCATNKEDVVMQRAAFQQAEDQAAERGSCKMWPFLSCCLQGSRELHTLPCLVRSHVWVGAALPALSAQVRRGDQGWLRSERCFTAEYKEGYNSFFFSFFFLYSEVHFKVKLENCRHVTWHTY